MSDWVCVNDFFAMTGIPNTLMVLVIEVCPPPVPIWPQTAAKLHSHRFMPPLSWTCQTWSHWLHLLPIIEANPCRFSPISTIVPVQDFACRPMSPRYSLSFPMFIILDPSIVHGVSVDVSLIISSFFPPVYFCSGFLRAYTCLWLLLFRVLFLELPI